MINPEKNESDVTVRPKNLDEFIGQKEVVNNLKVYLEASQLRKEPLDHILFSGPPGLGKTTLSRILSQSQNSAFHQISAPNLNRPGDLAKILTSLNENDILFIDEIHRIPAPVEEVLYSAMEDGLIDITLTEGMGASNIQINLPPFTLVGATTKPGSLSSPLRDRFGINLRLEFYENDDLVKILKRCSKIWALDVDEKGLNEIASRSRKTPRVALRLLKRIWDFALVNENNIQNSEIREPLAPMPIDFKIIIDSFKKMGVDNMGFSNIDIQLMKILAEHYNGGPVGLKPLAAIIAEDLVTIEDYIEPYLVRIGFIKRTPRGRMLSDKAYEHLNLESKNKKKELELFDETM